MRVLGIDPGTSLIGYGIVDADGKRYWTVDFGVLRTPANVKNTSRVVPVHDFFQKLIKKFRPDQIAIETLFFFKNSKTVIGVSEMRGVILLAAAQSAAQVREFTPLQIKQAVSGYGRADKVQVQRMVKIILSLEKLPKPDDVTDALALAICCLNTKIY